MAKKGKWEKLNIFLETELELLTAKFNRTAEEDGMITAYLNVSTAMGIYEREEKKLDKA